MHASRLFETPRRTQLPPRPNQPYPLTPHAACLTAAWRRAGERLLQLSVTRSFGLPVTTFDRLIGAVTEYATRAGEKLRSHGLVAARLTTFFHTNRHKPERPQHAGSRTVALHPMTNDSLELLAAARRGAERAWRDGYAYTKAGIMLDDLVAADMRPRTLFEADGDKRARLMDALDEINGRYGKWTAVTAAHGFKREWKLRSEMRSPSWTTSIAEVPSVGAT